LFEPVPTVDATLLCRDVNFSLTQPTLVDSI